MRVSSELKALIVAAADPADKAARLVLADWLDDHGDGMTAYALRWMVRHGREPHLHVGWLWYRQGIDDRNPLIFPVNRRKRRMPLVASWLPEVVGREMPDRLSGDWFTAVKKLGRSLARIKAMVDL